MEACRLGGRQTLLCKSSSTRRRPMERERTREHLSPSETLACAAAAGPTPWLPEAPWALAGRRETGPHGRWSLETRRPSDARHWLSGSPVDGCAVAVEQWGASPPIHPARWLQRQQPQSPRPRSRTRRLAATKSAPLSAYPLASLAERR
jgi:hypothetical protein